MENNEIKNTIEDTITEEALDNESFVGIHFKDGKFTVKFPLGYYLPKEPDLNEEIRRYEFNKRKDILLLMKTLSYYRAKDKVIRESFKTIDNFDKPFPIYAYMYVYNYYNKHGYYIPKERTYKIDNTGKINWNRTIKQIQPIVSHNKIIYIDTVRNKLNYNENELIAILNKWCVYESFLKIGCLFSSKMPKKHVLKGNKKQYVRFLSEKIKNTFNDDELELFKNMKKILETESNDKSKDEYYFGTTSFNLIWEAMINDVYGISKTDKDFLHPHITWKLPNNRRKELTLRPDTIMKVPGESRADKIYILDAKYYKGGNDEEASMPGGESVLKQLVYAEKFKRLEKYKNIKLLNAFILPYDRITHNGKVLQSMGNTEEDWFTDNYKTQHFDKDFDYVEIQAIQLDTKHLMENHSKATQTIFEEMAEEIEKNFYAQTETTEITYVIDDDYSMAASTKINGCTNT